MIPASEFKKRRDAVISKMESDSIMLVFSGVAKVSSADEDFGFEVNRNFYYLTGIDQQDSVLMLVNSEGETRQYLFVSPFDESKEKWYGKRLTAAEASHLSGCTNVLMRNTFDSKIDEALNPDIYSFGEIETVYIDIDRELKLAEDTYIKDFVRSLAATYKDIKTKDAYGIITTERLIKSSREIQEFREAISITRDGLMAIWNQMKPGLKEYELADTFLHTINDRNGYEGLSFPTIMASGIHGACLHYPTPLDTLKDGDLLLSDLGARKCYYCADITRTVPINGKYSPFQKEVYEVVLEANKRVAEMARPGLTIQDLQDATVEFLAKKCVEKGWIKEENDIINYYFHGVSHLIGLDTHDPYLNPLGRDSKKIPLAPGMVISDEPGLYMADRGLGIRIEDDLLITDTGCEVLSAGIPKEIEDIERLLASR